MAPPQHIDIGVHRWRRLYTPLEIVFPTVCYFHEAQVVAKNSSKQLICLLDDIVPFHLDLQFIQLSASRHPSPWDHDIGITELGSSASWLMDMTALVRNANLWTDLGTIRQHHTTTKLRMHNSTYIAEPTSKGYSSLPGSQRHRN